MDELFLLLFGLVCVLAAITVIGHGIWVALAWIFSLTDPDSPQDRQTLKPPAPLAARQCPRCGLAIEAGRCVACDWPTPVLDAQKRPVAAVISLQGQIERLTRLGLIEAATSQALNQTLEAERLRLTAVREAPAAPVTAPTAPGFAKAPTQAIDPADMVAAELVELLPDEPASATPKQPLATAAIVATPKPDAREFVSPTPLSQRAEEYQARREAWEAITREKPVAPPAPRRSWTDVLGAFMEERNMRWGELVGGLLIVCGSIALVVSFWSAIAERPWLKFALFNGVTAGLFGVGFYSEHRWRLRTTSQGLLTIGSLLVPLNFLAIAAMSAAPTASGVLTIVGEIASAAAFATMIYFAGRVLLPGGSLLLVVGLLVPALTQLLVRRFVDPAAPLSTLAGLVAVPLASYLGVNAWTIARAARKASLDERDVNAILKLLGLTTFATLLPLALLLVKSERPLEVLRQLPLIACLLGLAPMSAGLLLWQKLSGRELPALRTTGTSVAVLGAAVSLAGLVLGWPDPWGMLPAALLEFAIFSFVAWQFRLPAAHLLAAVCLAVAYLLGIWLGDGQIAWSGNQPQALVRALLSAASGTLLPPLVAVYAAAMIVAHRYRPSDAWAFTCAMVGLAAISTALVSWYGFGVEGDPTGAAWIYLLYAGGCLAASARSQRAIIAWLGAGLLLAATVQAVVFRYGAWLELPAPEVSAILLYGSVCLGIAVVVGWLRWADEDSRLGEVLQNAAFFSSLAGLAWLTYLIPSQAAAFHPAYWAWLAAIWLTLALTTGWLPVWTMFQVAVNVAVVFTVAAWLGRYEWFHASARPWLDPWTWQAVGLALTATCLAWTLARVAVEHLARREDARDWVARARELFATPWLLVDRITSGALVGLLVGMSIYAALPGTAQELSPRLPLQASGSPPIARAEAIVPPITNFEWLAVPHAHAADYGSWLLLAALVVLIVAMLRERLSVAWLLCLFVVLAMACPLLASRWEADLAVASALRWLSALVLLVGSVPIWARGWIARQAQRVGWPAADRGGQLVSSAFTLVFALGLLPQVAMAAHVAIQALSRAHNLPELWDDSYLLMIVSAASVLAAGASRAVPWQSARSQTLEPRASWTSVVGGLVLVLGTAPLLSVLLFHVGVALRQTPILGPDPASLFARMGTATSYAVPILLTALVLVGYALRERSSGFALAGGLVLNAGATAAYLLAAAKGGLTFEPLHWIRLAQLNASVAAGYLLAWVGVLLWDRRRRESREPVASDFLLSIQVALAPALAGLTLLWAWLQLFWDPTGDPQQPRVLPVALADGAGMATLLAAVAGVSVALWATGRRGSLLGFSALLTALVVFAAVWTAGWDTGNWLAYHTLFVGHAAVAAILFALAWRNRYGGWRSGGLLRTDNAEAAEAPARVMWVVVQAALVGLLATRELMDHLWWPVSGFAYLGMALAPGLAWLAQQRRYLYLAAMLINLAGLLAAAELNWINDGTEFVAANIVLLALPVVAWLGIELGSIRKRPWVFRINAPGAHRVAARLALVLLALLVSWKLLANASLSSAAPLSPLIWLALVATTIATLACLWDAWARESIASLYFLGLVACGVVLAALDLNARWLLFTGTIFVAAYSLLTSYLWSRRAGLLAYARLLGIPCRAEVELAGLAWLAPCNLLLVAGVVLMTLGVELTESTFTLRLLAAQATLAQVVSVALLARGDRRGTLQSLSLLLGALGAVMFGWAWLGVDSTFTLLHGLVVLAAALAVVATLYGFVLGKLLRDTSDWLAPAQRLTPTLAAVSAAAILATLGVEIFQFSRDGAVAIAPAAIFVVAVTLAALCVASLAAAILPGRDPLGLSERGRTLYVYGAEIILALLFVHIRLTMPWLFSGFFQQYWPLVIMAIAFAGVGFAEFFQRRDQRVLAEPLQNTGALLPVLGYWAADSRVEYSLLLLAVGVLYAGLSVARRSFGFGVLAALAANGGLWFFLNRQEGFGFLAHPQIWLIPPAVCVLVAAYLNRQQLSDAQMTGVRYFTSMSIYVSSTADIFLNGVAQAPWLPLVLAGLSILGIVAGILMRVRAFLFLGTSFLCLALFTIIWHAAVDLEQTWIWAATVILFGILVFVVVGLFEKKRQEMLALVEKLKQWEG